MVGEISFTCVNLALTYRFGHRPRARKKRRAESPPLDLRFFGYRYFFPWPPPPPLACVT